MSPPPSSNPRRALSSSHSSGVYAQPLPRTKLGRSLSHASWGVGRGLGSTYWQRELSAGSSGSFLCTHIRCLLQLSLSVFSMLLMGSPQASMCQLGSFLH